MAEPFCAEGALASTGGLCRLAAEQRSWACEAVCAWNAWRGRLPVHVHKVSRSRGASVFAFGVESRVSPAS